MLFVFLLKGWDFVSCIPLCRGIFWDKFCICLRKVSPKSNGCFESGGYETEMYIFQRIDIRVSFKDSEPSILLIRTAQYFNNGSKCQAEHNQRIGVSSSYRRPLFSFCFHVLNTEHGLSLFLFMFLIFPYSALQVFEMKFHTELRWQPWVCLPLSKMSRRYREQGTTLFDTP